MFAAAGHAGVVVVVGVGVVVSPTTSSSKPEFSHPGQGAEEAQEQKKETRYCRSSRVAGFCFCHSWMLDVGVCHDDDVTSFLSGYMEAQKNTDEEKAARVACV